MTDLSTSVFAVRANMVDGSSIDLLLFFDIQAAQEHRDYVRKHCTLLGYDAVEVVHRRVIGANEAIERRAGQRSSVNKRRRSDV